MYKQAAHSHMVQSLLRNPDSDNQRMAITVGMMSDTRFACDDRTVRTRADLDRPLIAPADVYYVKCFDMVDLATYRAIVAAHLAAKAKPAPVKLMDGVLVRRGLHAKTQAQAAA